MTGATPSSLSVHGRCRASSSRTPSCGTASTCSEPPPRWQPLGRGQLRPEVVQALSPPLQPATHVHVAVHRRRRAEVFLGLVALVGARTLRTRILRPGHSRTRRNLSGMAARAHFKPPQVVSSPPSPAPARNRMSISRYIVVAVVLAGFSRGARSSGAPLDRITRSGHRPGLALNQRVQGSSP